MVANGLGLALLLMSLHLSADFYAGIYNPLIPWLRGRLDLTLTLTTILAGASMATANYFQMFVGIWGDRFGRRRFVVAGIALAAVGMCCIGFAPTLFLLALALVAGGVGNAMFHPCSAAIAGGVGAASRRSTSIAIYMFGGNIGLMLPPLIAPRLVERNPALLALLAIPGLIAAAVAWRLLPSDAVAPEARKGATLRDLAAVFRRIWPIHLDVIFRFIPLGVFATMIPNLGASRGLPAVQAGQALFYFFGAGTLGIAVGGFLATHFSGRWRVILCELGAGVFLFLAPTAQGWHGVSLLAAGSFLIYSVIPVQIAAAQRLSPRTESAASGIVMGLAYGNAALLIFPVGAIAERLTTVLGSESLAIARVMQGSTLFLFLAAGLVYFLESSD